MKNRIFSFITTLVMLCAFVGVMPEMEVEAICCRKDGFDKSKYTLTGNMAQDVATIAKSQKGRTCDQFGYSGVDYGQWCDEFVADCIENAGGNSSIVGHGGNVWDFKRIMGEKGAKEVSSPQTGDLIFFTKGHVEIVTKVVNGIVYCAGGNNGNSPGSCAGERDASYVGTVSCYLRPNYSSSSTSKKWYDDYSPVDLGDNFYAYIKNQGVDVALSNIENKNVQGCEQVATKNQIWNFRKQNDGSYAILSYQDGLSMDVTSYGIENGTNIQMTTFSGNTAQKFYIYYINASYFFRPVCSDLVFDMDLSSYNLETWVFDSTYSSKQFKIDKIDCNGNLPVDIGSGFYGYIVNKGVYMLLSNVNGSNVQGCEQINTANQIWKFIRQNDGSYAILSHQDGLSMDVSNYGTENGTNIQMRTYSGNIAQRFFIYNINDSYFFKPVCSDLVFDMDLSSYNLETWVFDSTYSSKQFEIQKINLSNTVNLNSNGGLCSITSKKVTYGGSYDSLPTPIRTGYTFEGWYTEKDGGTKITTDTIVTATSDQTLYAHWKKIYYEVYFDANGGKSDASCLSIFYDSTYDELANASRDGYKFLGWYTKKDGGTLVTNDTVFKLTTDQTLYAHWEKLNVKGDVNTDGKLTVSDVVLLQKWLVAIPDVKLADWKAADLNADGRLNVFDLCLMKRYLIKESSST